jgi:hypothetical protein
LELLQILSATQTRWQFEILSAILQLRALLAMAAERLLALLTPEWGRPAEKSQVKAVRELGRAKIMLAKAGGAFLAGPGHLERPWTKRADGGDRFSYRFTSGYGRDAERKWTWVKSRQFAKEGQQIRSNPTGRSSL